MFLIKFQFKVRIVSTQGFLNELNYYLLFCLTRQVCGGRVLDLFHSRELMSLVAGTEHYNWKELEESANYKVGSKVGTIFFIKIIIHKVQ